MRGREFLVVADALLGLPDAGEAHWRSAIGRAYYAMMLEARDLVLGWGIDVPHGRSVHLFIRLCFEEIAQADPSIKEIFKSLKLHNSIRNEADYTTEMILKYINFKYRATEAVEHAGVVIAMLDELNEGSARRQRAIAALREAMPKILKKMEEAKSTPET